MQSNVLYIDGTSREVKPENGVAFSLVELRQFVGGDIDVCRAKEAKMILVVNDNGVMDNLEYNEQASSRLHDDYENNSGLGIRGNALYCHTSLVP